MTALLRLLHVYLPRIVFPHHLISQCFCHKMADPLSITASIVGIVAAASKVLSLLGDITDAPRSIVDLLNEVYDLRLIFCNLQSFIDRTRRFDPSRLALIQLGDLVAILTRTVITFSELESIVRPLCDREKLSTW